MQHFVLVGPIVAPSAIAFINQWVRQTPAESAIVWYDPGSLKGNPILARLASDLSHFDVAFKPLPDNVARNAVLSLADGRPLASVPWASSADLLRERVLRQFGGPHVDDDVAPGAQKRR